MKRENASLLDAKLFVG